MRRQGDGAAQRSLGTIGEGGAAQRTAREGPATNRNAEALGSSARTGREQRRHRDAGQRRSKAAACNGDGLIRAAKALLCGAERGEGKAIHGMAKARRGRDWMGDGVAGRSKATAQPRKAVIGWAKALKCNIKRRRGTAQQCDATEQHRPAERGNGLASPRDALRWRSKEPRRNAKALLCSASPCDGNAARCLDAQRSSKAVNGGGDALPGVTRRSDGSEIWKRPVRDGSLDAGMQDGRRGRTCDKGGRP